MGYNYFFNFERAVILVAEDRTRRNSCRIVLRMWVVSRRSKDFIHRREWIPEGKIISSSSSSLDGEEEETLALDLSRLEDSSAGRDVVVVFAGSMTDSR